MAAKLLDGKALAQQLCAQWAQRIETLSQQLHRPPGLAVVLVGDDPASRQYVRQKQRKAQEMGLMSQVVRLPASASQQQVLEAVDSLNASQDVDGFLVQLPLPTHVDAQKVLERIDPAKDADGLHPVNLGKLVAGLPGPRPATPAGVMRLLAHAGICLAGARAVVVGRSTLVGKPTALWLLEQHATVTLCHSRTRDLAAEIQRAEVVVVAVGQPHLIPGAWLAPGATVIDVGIHRIGDRWIGDVDFASAQSHVGAITPVPGGVGPMTIASLIDNTLLLAGPLDGLTGDR